MFAHLAPPLGERCCLMGSAQVFGAWVQVVTSFRASAKGGKYCLPCRIVLRLEGPQNGEILNFSTGRLTSPR